MADAKRMVKYVKTNKKSVTKDVKKLKKAVKHLQVVDRSDLSAAYDTFGSYDPLLIGGTIYSLHSTAQTLALGFDKPRLVYNSLDLHINFEYKVNAGGATVSPFAADAAAVSNTSGQIRIILFCDQASDQAQPTIVGAATSEAVLENGGATSEFNYQLSRNANMKRRYKILKDKTITWLTTQKTKHIILKHRFKNHVATYSNNAGAITDYISGQLFLIVIPSDSMIAQTVGNTEKLAVNYQSKLLFSR